MDEPLSDNGSEGHGGFDEGGEEIDLTAAPAGGLQDGAGAMGEKPKKKERDRKAEAAANKVVADIAVGFRDFDDMEKCEKVSEVLIRALSQHDPDFKRKMAASDILEALKAGLKDQKGGPEVSFVRRAIVGQVAVGVGQRKYTASMVGDLLGVDRKRVRPVNSIPDVVESAKKARAQRSDAFGDAVDQAVKDFVLCYWYTTHVHTPTHPHTHTHTHTHTHMCACASGDEGRGYKTQTRARHTREVVQGVPRILWHPPLPRGDAR